MMWLWNLVASVALVTWLAITTHVEYLDSNTQSGVLFSIECVLPEARARTWRDLNRKRNVYYFLWYTLPVISEQKYETTLASYRHIVVLYSSRKGGRGGTYWSTR